MPTPQFHRRTAVFMATAASLLSGHDPATAATLDDVHNAASSLAQVRAETTKLESDWRWQRDTLAASIDVLQQRIRALESRKELLETKYSAENREIAEMEAKAAIARDRYEAVEHELKDVAARIVSLRPWLPPRLAFAVALPCRTLAEANLSAGERMQHLATVWSRCAQFNRTITYAEETLTPAGAAGPRVMDVLYWGMSHAYALDRSAGNAYFGFPGKDGWAWELQPAMAENVGRLLAIYQDRADPEFVPAPAQVSDGLAGGKP